jgi:hypothetical protein
MLTGKPTTQYGRLAYSLIPEVGAVVANLGGIGFSGEKEVVYLSQWVVEGHQISAPGDGGIYRTLEWKLSENDFTSQSHAHSSVVHTGLALKHEAKPFYIKVKIEGKLRKLTDRLTSQFVFPPRSRKGTGDCGYTLATEFQAPTWAAARLAGPGVEGCDGAEESARCAP